MHEPIRFLPLTALNDALRAVYAGELGIFGLYHEIGVLMAWGVLGFVICARAFRWQ